jgi:capsid protein
VGNRSGIKIVESGIFKGRKILNGVVKNEFNRTIAFYVLGDTKAEDIVVDAGSMVHHYDPEYHSQGRGVPAFAAVIPELRKAKTSEEWELMAQLVHSAHSIIEYNDSGAADFTGGNQPEPDSDGLDVQTFAGGMVRYMKANSGNKIESITSARPSDMWDRFQDRIQRSACVSVAWPFELTWKPEGLNGVSVRSVQDKARHSVARRQVVLAKGRRKEVEFAIAVGIKNGYLAAPPIASDWDKFSFSLPPQMTIDPRHDSKTEEDQYKLGRVNMTALLKRDGKSYLPHLKERLNEICLRKKWIAIYEEKFDCQIDDREVFMLTPNEMAEAVEVESEEIETQTENQDDK